MARSIITDGKKRAPEFFISGNLAKERKKMKKGQFLKSFFYATFPFFFFRSLETEREEILKGLKDITPEELAEAAGKAHFFPQPSIMLREVEVSPVSYQGAISTKIFFLSDVDDKKLRQHLLSKLQERLVAEPRNSARQRALLLGLVLQGGI